MPLIIPPGFVQASFVFTGIPGTQPYVTTLGLDSSDWGGDFVSLANFAKANYAENLGPVTNNALTLDRVTLFIGDDGPSGSVDSDTEPTAMTDASVFGPTAMSLIARKNTAERGRRGRGRMFLPGTAAEAAVEEDGSVTTGQITEVNTRLATFLEVFVEGDDPDPAAPPVLFHSLAPADPTPISSLTVAPLVGWIGGRIR